jgi:uncharacterized protein DUF6174
VLRVLLALLALAAPAQASEQSRLDDARDRWQAADIADYSYDVQRYCFCKPLPAPMHFVVRDGRPVQPKKSRKRLQTVPRLFRVVQQALDNGFDRVDVDYAGRGFPKRILLDRDAMLADEEVTYEITGFRGR